MKLNFGKYTLLAHIGLGSFLTLMHDNWFECKIQDNLYWFAVVIVVMFYSGVAEFIQGQSKTGTEKAIGAIRTCIPLLPYVIYNLIKLI